MYGLILAMGLLGVPATSNAPSNVPAIPDRGTWVTLGTMGGPIAHPRRSQPSNALLTKEGVILVDTGDGTAQQLAKAKIPLPQVSTVLLSHLHWDHTGGLAAILGLRYQTNVPGKLKIFGPPGTKALVDGILASMAPGAAAGYGDPNGSIAEPAASVEVTELVDGSMVRLGTDLTVTAAQNSHYSFAPGSDLDAKYKSLSYRFALPGRVIVYTGDTGPSSAVERLATGADLLVSELIDVDATVLNVRRNTPEMGEKALAGLTWHLAHHHLTAEQVGVLAKRAGVKSLVITHIVPGDVSPEQQAKIMADIRRSHAGPVAIADDLNRF